MVSESTEREVRNIPQVVVNIALKTLLVECENKWTVLELLCQH